MGAQQEPPKRYAVAFCWFVTIGIGFFFMGFLTLGGFIASKPGAPIIGFSGGIVNMLVAFRFFRPKI
jgi:hypothetical protein